MFILKRYIVVGISFESDERDPRYVIATNCQHTSGAVILKIIVEIHTFAISYEILPLYQCRENFNETERVLKTYLRTFTRMDGWTTPLLSGGRYKNKKKK